MSLTGEMAGGITKFIARHHYYRALAKFGLLSESQWPNFIALWRWRAILTFDMTALCLEVIALCWKPNSLREFAT